MKKILFGAVTVLLLVAALAVTAFAATPSSGYCVNSAGQQTNIKYTMTAEGVLTFEIDPNATDKILSTILYNKDPVDGSTGSWDRCPTTFSGATKVIIGDGITELHCLMFQKGLKTVEIPQSLTVLGGAFQTCHSLSSVYIRGTEPQTGLFDLSNITSMGTYCFDDCKSMTAVKLNPNLVGSLPVEGFKCTALKEIEIPAGVTTIPNKCFMQTYYLKTVTVLGMETTFASDSVFEQNDTFPAIKAKAGSKAEEFAKANGYTFIDLDTGETTKGTKAVTGEATGGGTSSGSTTTPSADLPEFNHDGATIWGHSSGKYNGGDIINTYWAYYQETKTLEFVSATTKYNETGTISHVDKDYTNWGEYKEEIEHIIVGDYIIKVSGSAFMNYPALIDVKLGKHVNQIDPNAFNGCTNLTTIWRNTNERVEGQADLRGLQKVNNIIAGTKIGEVILPNNTKELNVDLPTSVKTIRVNAITPELIEFAKVNLFNLQNITNPEEIYEYWVYVDPSLPACGGRSVFSFDEATGTLTIHGAGEIDGITNYYGGGSKNQPWFSIRNQVKHIVIGDNITGIGKYAFCEFANLETVQIPDSESFVILNAAFEKCYNLKSVYRAGTEPIEGTLDIRNVHEITAWSFAYDYLIANIVISPNVAKIGTSVFEENITINLANVYGTPGSYAETYASENGLTFYDISSNTPSPIACVMPESTEVTEETEETKVIEETEVIEVTDTAGVSETAEEEKPKGPIFVDGDLGEEAEGGTSSVLPIIIAAAAVAVIAVVVIVVVVSKKKKAAK